MFSVSLSTHVCLCTEEVCKLEVQIIIIIIIIIIIKDNVMATVVQCSLQTVAVV